MKAICLKCGKYNGPNVPLGADYAGWICDPCYDLMMRMMPTIDLDYHAHNNPRDKAMWNAIKPQRKR